MLVPGHVCSLYLATGGANGPALGSDEKEIVMLDYTVIDALTKEEVFAERFLVKPTNQVGSKDNNNKKDKSDAALSPASVNDATSPPAPEFTFDDAVLQSVGTPLKEVIEKFDQEIRARNIDPDSPTFRIITDGQLPLRQCLHPEACAKDIELPNYYCKFSDLRKEYVRYKSAGLSRALVPVKDVKNLPNMPPLPAQPSTIAEMFSDLQMEIEAQDDDSDFYMKESRQMQYVIKTMLAAGHKFETSELINLSLEPGICSIDDEIDGQCIVRARGLPWQSSDQDIAKFFRGLNVAKGGVALCLSPQGRRNGEALIRFVSQEHRDMALKRHKHHIGNRYIEVYRATGEDFINVAGGASNEAQAFLSKGAEVIIRMRGLPYLCTSKQVLDFFATGNEPCHVLDGPDGILFVKKPDGRATGDAFVLFAVEADAKKALARHRESIGNRYIELFRSTIAEVQQVLNRSMDIKTYENNTTTQPSLMAQLPPVQFNLLPQHVITSGIAKNCIRLRGLPYTIEVEHILHFLEDFSKHIIYQGVHMVYNAQGQPSGEAFIQMDSEEAAYASAQQKHNKYMVFGKKNRYIEVFQCSGDDMNLVLNGGVHSPVNSRKSPLLSPGMLPPQAPQTQSLPSPGLPLTLSQPLALSLTRQPHQPSNSGLLAQQAQMIAQQNLIARQAAVANAAVAAATASQNATQTNEQSQYYVPNFALIQSQSANNLHNATLSQQHVHESTYAKSPFMAAQAQLIAQNNHAVHHSSASTAPTSVMHTQLAQSQQPPFLFMPRTLQHPTAAPHLASLNQLIPMNFLPSPYATHSTPISLLSAHSLAPLQLRQQQSSMHPPPSYNPAQPHHTQLHPHHAQAQHLNAQQAALQQLSNQEMLLHGRPPSGADFARLNRDQNLRYVALPTAANANASLMHAASIKRSYESAFHQDPSTSPLTTANAPKRFFL